MIATHGASDRKPKMDPQVLVPEFKTQFVLRAAYRWRVLGLLAGLLMAAASIWSVQFWFTPVYEAVVLFRINANAPYLVVDSRLESEQLVSNEIELLQSGLVLTSLLEDPEMIELLTPADGWAASGVEEENGAGPIKTLQKGTLIQKIGTSDLVKLSYSAADPDQAATIANAIADAYLELRGQHGTQRTNRVVELLTEEKSSREKAVLALREEVRELAAAQAVDNPLAFLAGLSGGRAAHSAGGLGTLQQRIVHEEVEQAILGARIMAFQEWEKTDRVRVRQMAVDEAIAQNPDVQELTARIATSRLALEDYKQVTDDLNLTPYYRQLNSKVVNDEARLKQLRKTLDPKITAQLAQGEADLRQDELSHLQNEMMTHRVTQSILEERFASQMAAKKPELTGEEVESTGDALDLEFKMNELAKATEALNLIESRSLVLRTESRAPQQVEVMRRATAPVEPLRALPIKEMTVAGLLCFLLPFALAAGWEWRVRRVSNADHLESYSQMSVVGEIAKARMRRRHLLRAKRGDASRRVTLFEESVDALRTSLILGDEEHTVQVIAIASASTGEGKTSLATQLAVSIAEATGELTLLVDGDMRFPDLHRMSGVPLEPGLSRVLSHECSLKEAVTDSECANLQLLPAGKLFRSPHTLVGNGGLSQLLAEARDCYRHVIIDTPPVLAAAEAMVLARAADITLVCARQDVSRLSLVRKVHDRLTAAQVNLAGVVLNGVPAKSYTASNGYYGYQIRRS
jgi:succinoglycan biosynthesis transport protein ExoP